MYARTRLALSIITKITIIKLSQTNLMTTLSNDIKAGDKHGYVHLALTQINNSNRL